MAWELNLLILVKAFARARVWDRLRVEAPTSFIFILPHQGVLGIKMYVK